MSLRRFEYALAAAEAGSVTAVAESLRVAQPSMSQQIRGLERELGVTLFSRTPTGLAPTAVGRAFLRDAEVAVRAARRARATARAGAEELEGELVVSAQTGLGTRQLPGALSALRRRFLRLGITVFEEANPAELERLARRGVVDLGLTAGPCKEGLYKGYYLGDEGFVVVTVPAPARAARRGPGRAARAGAGTVDPIRSRQCARRCAPGRAAGQRVGSDHGRPRVADGDGGALGRPRAGSDARSDLGGASRVRAPHTSRFSCRLHAHHRRCPPRSGAGGIGPTGIPAAGDMAPHRFLRQRVGA